MGQRGQDGGGRGGREGPKRAERTEGEEEEEKERGEREREQDIIYFGSCGRLIGGHCFSPVGNKWALCKPGEQQVGSVAAHKIIPA